MSAADTIMDAVVVDEANQAPAPMTTAVVRRERRSEVVRPLDAGQLVESFQEYQAARPGQSRRTRSTMDMPVIRRRAA